jgi:hypothetical protein
MQVEPEAPTVSTGHTKQFTVEFYDHVPRDVVWKVNDKKGGDSKTVGTIDSNGLYTAPDEVPDKPSPVVKISATLKQNREKTSSVTLVITASACPPVTDPAANPPSPCIEVRPHSTLVKVGKRMKPPLSATLQNGAHGEVQWEIKCPEDWVNCDRDGKPDMSQLGQLSTGSGNSTTYTAPGNVPSEQVKIRAYIKDETDATAELVIVKPEISVWCSSLPGAGRSGCAVSDFNRLANPDHLAYPRGRIDGLEVADNKDADLITAITSSKAMFSGSAISIDFSKVDGVNENNCKNYDWYFVVQAKESPTVIVYGPGDVGAGVCSERHYVIAFPVHVLWADVHAFPEFPDLSRTSPGDPASYTDCQGQYAPQTIFPCDKDSRLALRLLYKFGWLYNHLSPPGTVQASMSLIPVIGSGDRQLSFDVLADPAQKLGPGWLHLPLVFEKSTEARSNLDSLLFGLAYDLRWVKHPNLTQYPQENAHFVVRKPQIQFRSGPEIAPTAPHDVNLVESETIKLPIVFNFQQQPSALTVYPYLGVEEGSHFATHLREKSAILRGFGGIEGSFRWPYKWTKNFFGSAPLSIDYSYRMRWLAYDEPMANVGNNGPELLSNHRHAFFRGSLIAPLTQYLSFQTTVLHGSLPPDFRVLNTTLGFGLTITNQASSEH